MSKKMIKQAAPELCQAQIPLGQISYSSDIIFLLGYIPVKLSSYEVVFQSRLFLQRSH